MQAFTHPVLIGAEVVAFSLPGILRVSNTVRPRGQQRRASTVSFLNLFGVLIAVNHIETPLTRGHHPRGDKPPARAKCCGRFPGLDFNELDITHGSP